MNSPAGRLVFGWAVGIVAIGVVTVLIDLAGYVDFLDIRRGPTKEQLQNVFVLKSPKNPDRSGIDRRTLG